MRKSFVHFTSENEDMLSYDFFNSFGSNSSSIEKMKKILAMAISRELTHLQRLCLTEYYFGGKKMREIATDLDISPSTVTRHIQRAKQKLKNIAGYYS